MSLFSFYFKISAKKKHAAKPIAFLLNVMSNLASQIIKRWSDLQKNIAGRIPETTEEPSQPKHYPVNWLEHLKKSWKIM